MKNQDLVDNFLEQYRQVNAVDKKQDDLTELTKTLTIGVVVNTDDPLENGRLMIFCPALNDNPKKLLHLPWASYITPFGGSVNNDKFTRGHIPGQEFSGGAVHYGFWGIPEHGAHVLVGCINGDPRRRFWLGCIPQHQESHTMFNGRFKWDGDSAEGPYTSTNSPLEPIYTNMKKAFKGESSSAEWKSRVADYQATSVNEDVGEIPSPDKPTYLDNQYSQISAAEKDKWVKPILGAHGYDWTSNKKLGEMKASKVYGMMTPSGHSISMDDRAFNSRVKIKSAAGHQVLLDDTNERIYVSTYEGKSWVELDKSGNIDVFADRRLSIHATKDINIESDETVRIKGKKGIHLYAGDTKGQTPLEEIPGDGQIRFHSTDDMHIMSEKSIRTLAKEDMLTEVGGDTCLTVGGSSYTQVENDINTITNDGNLNTSITGQLNLNVSGDITQFSGHDFSCQAVNNMESHAYRGSYDMGAYLDITVSSKGANVGVTSETGNVTVSSKDETSMLALNESGATLYSETLVSNLSPNDIQVCVSPDLTLTQMLLNTPAECLEIPGVKVKFGQSKLDFQAIEDITQRLEDGLQGQLDTVETSVRKVNEFMAETADKWNAQMYRLNSFFFGIADAITNADPSSLEIPSLASGFPNLTLDLEMPVLALPNLALPELCVDWSTLLRVEGFPQIPESLFQLNINMGGWTKDAIQGWVDNIKNDIDDLAESFDLANAQAILQADINLILSSFTQLKDLTSNLVDVNITGNTAVYFQIAPATQDLLSQTNDYNNGAYNAGIQVGSKIANSIQKFLETLTGIDNNMSANQIDGYDFSGLQGAVDTLDGYITTLGGNT